MLKVKPADRILKVAWSVVLVFILLVPPGVTAGEKAPGAPDRMGKRQSVLILPFRNMAAIYGSHKNIRSPVNGRVFISGPVEEKAAVFMDNQLQIMLLDKDVYTLVGAERATDSLAAVSDRSRASRPVRELWAAVGRTLGADVVLGGFLYRFKDRTGNDYGVDDVASVAFDLHLVKVSNGRLQWSGRVDETQQPLSSNLFKINKFISRGGKWVTAREMAREGLRDLAAEMPE